MELLKLIGIIFVLTSVGLLLMSVRVLGKREDFRGGCANNNPMLKEQIGECTVCGRKSGEPCGNPETASPNPGT